MNLFRRILTTFRKPKPAPQQPIPEYVIVQIFPGQTCYELNLETGVLETIALKRIEGSKYMLLPKHGYMYEIAANKRNAARKLAKRLELINKEYSKQ